MKFGYARVSTDKQITDRQMDALRSYGVDEIFEEKISGTKKSRPQLNLLLSKLRTGDTLVVYELKRLGRNTKQLLALAEDFQANGIEFVSLTEQIDTTTPMGRFVFTTWCALAQLDRDIISENTKSGLAAAKARGRVGGRKPSDRKQVEKALKMYYTNDFSVKEILESTGISRTSLYKYVNKNKEEREKEHGKK
ncbi:MAG: recombinase family protein [Parabacteroides sp.]|jgi:DNA invertase Pin-like site-specific DNA recombinase|nr:recombinase family protein [Parabacteroides sp.]MDD4068181.1 recombinase family protein [Bacteroidales bacterium]